MRTSHIAVAQNDGMKAGLKAYRASLATSALEPVQAKSATIEAMSSNQRFRWYCDKFGAKVGTPAPKPKRTLLRRSTPTPQAHVETSLATEIAEAQLLLATLLARVEGSTASTPVPTPAKPKAGKASKWAVSVVARNGGKAKVGSKFSYTNGQGVKSAWVVTSIVSDTHVTAAKA